MKVHRDLSGLEFERGTAVTTGTFDGVHLGHKEVIKSLVDSAEKNHLESVLLTFYPHPRIVLEQDTDLKLLTTLDEKIEKLAETGIDHLVIVPFTKEFSRLTSMQFVRELLVAALNTKRLVIGYDHHFGRNREGSFEHLLEFGPVYGFEVEEIPAHNVEELKISSTKIRSALADGKVALSNKLLGYNYQLSGKVIRGEQIGSEIGFPTANISVGDARKIIPARGVYAAEVIVEGIKYKGMLNIGVKPTFGNNKESIEVHLFNFDKDIYNLEITLGFIKRIRSEMTFSSKEELVSQLTKDKEIVVELL